MKDKAIKDAMSSIENRIRHVYNQGYEDGIKDGKASVQIDGTEAYKLGYENGLTSKEYIQIDKSTAYKAGLQDAWELARELSNLGFNDTRKEIFGEKYGLSIDIIKNFSVDEVAAKIEEYEKKQKQTEKIKAHFEPVDGKPGYFWLSSTHLHMIRIEALAKMLNIDE